MPVGSVVFVVFSQKLLLRALSFLFYVPKTIEFGLKAITRSKSLSKGPKIALDSAP
jgi:hypothetical protein